MQADNLIILNQLRENNFIIMQKLVFFCLLSLYMFLQSCNSIDKTKEITLFNLDDNCTIRYEKKMGDATTQRGILLTKECNGETSSNKFFEVYDTLISVVELSKKQSNSFQQKIEITLGITLTYPTKNLKRKKFILNVDDLSIIDN